MTALDIRSRVVTVKDAAEATKLSVPTIRRMADLGQLRTVKLGRRRYIPKTELERLAKEVGA